MTDFSAAGWLFSVLTKQKSHLFHSLSWTKAGKGGGEKPWDALVQGNRVPGVPIGQLSSPKLSRGLGSWIRLPLSNGFWAPHSLKPWMGCGCQLPMLGCSPGMAPQCPMSHRAGATLWQCPPGTLATSLSLLAASLQGGLHQGSAKAAPAPSQPFLPGTMGPWASESPSQNRSLPTASTPAPISLPFPAIMPSDPFPRPSHTCTCAREHPACCAMPAGMAVLVRMAVPSPEGCRLL